MNQILGARKLAVLTSIGKVSGSQGRREEVGKDPSWVRIQQLSDDLIQTDLQIR